jgi:hypothetical protein
MRTLSTCGLTVGFFGLLLAGCATPGPVLGLAPVGPPASLPAALPQSAGTLLVYSAFYPGPRETALPEDVRQHSDYKLYAGDGRLVGVVGVVANRAGLFGEDPARMSLAPGRYRVEARSNRYGMVSVPVVIAVDQVTEVHLDDDSSLPAKTAGGSGMVRLSGGEFVGWSAAGR